MIHILIADDDPHTRLLLKMTLGKQEYSFTSCRDGEEVLECLALQEADLIVLDIKMPKVDGITLCQGIREQKHYEDVPILIVTGLSDEKLERKAMDAGADAFFTKPLNPTHVRDVVKSLLASKE